jgi:uncharacterized secreted repeat protein (TIGR03808 family)
LALNLRQAKDRSFSLLTRRSTLLLPLLVLPAVARAETILPNGSDQTELLQTAIDKAQTGSGVVQLGAGSFNVSGIKTMGDVQLSGIPGRTTLQARTHEPMLTVGLARNVSLEGIRFSADEGGDLAVANGVETLTITDCSFSGGITGLTLTACGGRISGNSFTSQHGTGLHALDSHNLKITGNTLADIGNNGIRVWRKEKGDDGTIVSDNQIARVAARDGGDGQNGNGINVYRAGNVIVSNNRISDCAFTAIRNNSGDGAVITGNSISRCKEVALYVEFAFLGANVSNNMLEDVAHGISITNFNEGGRLAVCNGNVIRGARGINAHGQPLGGGIFAEADTILNGNLIEEAENAGIALGWGAYGRNLSAVGNMLRNCGRGVTFSMLAPGPFQIVNNMIIGAKSGAVFGMDHENVVTGDLAAAGSVLPKSLRLGENTVL